MHLVCARALYSLVFCANIFDNFGAPPPTFNGIDALRVVEGVVTSGVVETVAVEAFQHFIPTSPVGSNSGHQE